MSRAPTIAMFIWPYIKALAKSWWALMSSAVFTLIAIYAAAYNLSNSWVVWASTIAALLLFLVASYLAWSAEYREKVESNQKLSDAEPRIMFGLLVEPDWSNLDSHGEFVFVLTNCGHRPATNVHLEPVHSVSRNFTIYFADVDVLPPDFHYRPIMHEIDDGFKRSQLDKRKLWEFFHNCPLENRSVETFDIVVRFRDKQEERRTTAKMQFDLNSKRLEILPH